MWNTNFLLFTPNQKKKILYCQNQNQVHGYGVYYGETCTLSLLFLFCIKYIQGWNTNHKLNDLTSKATTLKGLHLMSIPHSAAQCEKQLRQISVSVFLPVGMFRRFLCVFPQAVFRLQQGNDWIAGEQNRATMAEMTFR